MVYYQVYWHIFDQDLVRFSQERKDIDSNRWEKKGERDFIVVVTISGQIKDRLEINGKKWSELFVCVVVSIWIWLWWMEKRNLRQLYFTLNCIFFVITFKVLTGWKLGELQLSKNLMFFEGLINDIDDDPSSCNFTTDFWIPCLSQSVWIWTNMSGKHTKN